MKTELQKSTCKGCGKAVYFVKDIEGKMQILDATAPVYVQLEEAGYARKPEPQVQRITAYVSHFSTCASANDLSKKRKLQKEKTTTALVLSERMRGV